MTTAERSHTMKDYSDARFYAISGIGYGKGFTPEEAQENYVATQLRNYPARSTVYGTRKKWQEALTTGDAKAIVWEAPEGTTGFVLDGRVRWQDADGKYTDADLSHRYIRLGLKIENHYEDGSKVRTRADVLVPAPPEGDTDAYEEWEQDHIFAVTGTGKTDGDSAYFVEVVTSDCPDVIAVGTEYEFGL